MDENSKPTAEQAAMAADFIAAQAEMPNPKKDAVNPHFNNKFASLESVLSAGVPILNKHGFALAQQVTSIDGLPALKTQLIHKSGRVIEDTMLLLLQSNTPQAQGSALTYARRYALMALLGMAAEDDDGQAATSPAQNTQAPGPVTGPTGNPVADKAIARATQTQFARMFARLKDLGVEDKEKATLLLRGLAGRESLSGMPASDAFQLISKLDKLTPEDVAGMVAAIGEPTSDGQDATV